MKRRLIASLLAVCLVAGLLPTVALAAEPCTATVGCCLLYTSDAADE